MGWQQIGSTYTSASHLDSTNVEASTSMSGLPKYSLFFEGKQPRILLDRTRRKENQ